MLDIVSNQQILKGRQQTIFRGGKIQTDAQKSNQQGILSKYRKQGFFGIIPCHCKSGIYYYLHLNDDNVAEHLLSFGCFGYERATAALFTKLSGNADIVLDLGSFTGYYSILSKKFGNAKKIIAIEANPLNFQRFKDNLKINGLKVQAFNYAIIPSNSPDEFIEIKFNPQLPVLDTGGFVDHRSTENWGKKNKTESYFIKTTTIPQLLNDSDVAEISNYILAKVDIEGLEIPIIFELVEKYSDKIIIIVEIIQKSTFLKLLDRLKSLNSFTIAFINEDELSICNVLEQSWENFNVVGSRNFLICASNLWKQIKYIDIKDYLLLSE